MCIIWFVKIYCKKTFFKIQARLKFTAFAFPFVCYKSVVTILSFRFALHSLYYNIRCHYTPRAYIKIINKYVIVCEVPLYPLCLEINRKHHRSNIFNGESKHIRKNNKEQTRSKLFQR